MSDKLLHDYIAEEFSRDVIVLENGFVSYKVLGPELLIGDLFIEKEKRGSGLGQELGRACEKIARENGCTYLSCNVYVDEARPEYNTDKIRKFIKFGFNVLRIVNNQLIMVKELNDAV